MKRESPSQDEIIYIWYNFYSKRILFIDMINRNDCPTCGQPLHNQFKFKDINTVYSLFLTNGWKEESRGING